MSPTEQPVAASTGTVRRAAPVARGTGDREAVDRGTIDQGTGDREAVDVSVVVVNWNTRDLLAACLRSIRRHAPAGCRLEVLVVDNGSTDGSAALVRSAWPDVQLLANTSNRGFAAANNQALAVSQGRQVLFLNSDAELTAGCLEALLERMGADPRIGAVGPRLVYGDGRWQRWTAGREPTLWTALTYFWFLERLAPMSPIFGGLYSSVDSRAAHPVDWISGAALLCRREALATVGGMDETLFYMEDVDLCRRLREGGWSVWYCPQGQAVHLMGESTRRQTGSVSPAALRSFHRYFRRRHGRAAGVAVRAIAALGFGVRAGIYRAVARLRPDEPRLSEQARAHWAYCRLSLAPNRFGGTDR